MFCLENPGQNVVSEMEEGDGSAWLLQKKGVKPSRGRIEL